MLPCPAVHALPCLSTQVVLAPDPDLAEHLLVHGVMVSSSSTEGNRLQRAFLIQIARYTMPFVVISMLFWLLHTWILDPVPNQFRRREFIRYRREILHVGTKLNFRSPARQVRYVQMVGKYGAWNTCRGFSCPKQGCARMVAPTKSV
jgi:cell division protease FtsH